MILKINFYKGLAFKNFYFFPNRTLSLGTTKKNMSKKVVKNSKKVEQKTQNLPKWGAKIC